MLWLTSSTFQPQEPFHLFPPPSLFVTLIYFWHCALAFSKGKTVGNLISGPICPFFSITSSPVIDVTVAAPWCKWLISICFHPRGLTRTIRGPQDSAAATTKYVFVVRPVFKNVIKSTSLRSGLPDEVESCHLSVKLEKPACIMGQYSTLREGRFKKTAHGIMCSQPILAQECAHIRTTYEYTRKYALRMEVANLIWKQSTANETAPSILKAGPQSKEARLAGLVAAMEHILHLMSDQAGRYQAGCQPPPTG